MSAAPDTESRKWSNPYVTVITVDGQEWGVQTYNPDMLRWERTTAQHNWGTMQESPATWLTFMAWSAGRRDGKISTDVKFEAFRDEICLQVTADQNEIILPTPPAPVAG